MTPGDVEWGEQLYDEQVEPEQLVDRLALPVSGAPAGVAVSVQGKELPEQRTHAWWFREWVSYDLIVENIGETTLRAWLGDQEQTHALCRVGSGAYWSFNWGDHVGLSRLRLKADGQTILDLPVEVRSRKLGYEEDYRRLLNELADWLAALAFSVRTPTTLPTVVQTPERGSLYLTYLILQRLMEPRKLPAAFERVRLQPHRRLVREPQRVDFAQTRQLDARALADIVAAPDLVRGSRVLSPTVARTMRGHIPTRLLDTRPRTDLDTPENRFVAYLLQAMEQRLSELERAFRRDALEHASRADLARSLAEDCRCWAQQVDWMGRAGFLAEVGPMTVFPAASQVLQRQEGYRELRDAYLQLLLSPHVRWAGLEELLNVPSRDVPTLYEYWCFFALADALTRATGVRPDWRDLVRGEGSLWEVDLRRGRDAHVHCGPVTLWYNRGFGYPNSYSLLLRPDYTVEIGGSRWLLDAKYRLEWQDLEKELQRDEPEERDREATFKRADLYKMHTYRDAIRGAEAVFILYPGDVFRAFGADGRRYDDPADISRGFAGVGAVPVRPERREILETLVRAMVQSSVTAGGGEQP